MRASLGDGGGVMDRITTGQRDMLRGLLRRAEYDTRAVTYMHRLVGAPERYMGRPVDEWLDSLSKREASQLIDQLERRAK